MLFLGFAVALLVGAALDMPSSFVLVVPAALVGYVGWRGLRLVVRISDSSLFIRNTLRTYEIGWVDLAEVERDFRQPFQPGIKVRLRKGRVVRLEAARVMNPLSKTRLRDLERRRELIGRHILADS